MNDHQRTVAWLVLSILTVVSGPTARAQTLVSHLTFGSGGGHSQGATAGVLVALGQTVSGPTGQLSTGFAFIAAGYGVSGTAIESPVDPALPRTFGLHQNYPNPFNPVTTVIIDVAQSGPVRLEVFDSLGRLRRVAFDAPLEAGSHPVTIEADDLESGVYVYRVRVGSSVAARRMVLFK